jgi:hypothetical protein
MAAARASQINERLLIMTIATSASRGIHPRNAL